jgi:hypothetical protein
MFPDVIVIDGDSIYYDTFIHAVKKVKVSCLELEVNTYALPHYRAKSQVRL